MEVVYLPVTQIERGDVRSRSYALEHKLKGLAESYEEVGMLQPIIVRQAAEQKYIVVAGERRYLAAVAAGLKMVPAVLQKGTVSIRQTQLVENLQREELNPLDRANAVSQFMAEEGLSKAAAARKLGVARTTLTDWLSVLDLKERYQKALLNNFYGGRSPLTSSHVALARRFAQKLGSDQMFEVAMDSILYYELTRSETKKVLEMAASRPNVSLRKAVRNVRLSAQDAMAEGEWEWDSETLVKFLARSGDYLVRTKDHDLAGLSPEDRKELLRQSRALQKLLHDLLPRLDQDSRENVS